MLVKLLIWESPIKCTEKLFTEIISSKDKDFGEKKKERVKAPSQQND